MKSLKYSVASLAMLLASGVAYAEDATTTPTKPAVESKIDCPAAGTVSEADLPAECKSQAASETPKQDQDNAAAGATTTAPANTVLASEFMGQSVYSTGNERVGEINDLVMSKELEGFVAVIGVGGFLGIGEKDVAIPVGEITASKDENNNLRLTIAASKEQLEAAPAFDRTPSTSASSSTDTTVTDPATTTTVATTELPKQDATTTTDTSTTATDTAASTATTEMPAQDSTSTSTSATVTDPAASTTAATEPPKEDSTAASTAAETDPAASTTATTEVPKQDADTTVAETQTDPSATTEVPKQDSSTTTAATEMPKQDSATVTTTAEDPATTAAKESVNPSTAVLASQFMGQAVYSTGNENVGEINDLVMSKELETVVAIIGVGGFLGIGEKDVAIPVSDLTATKDENNNLRLTISASKEQLEAAPIFDRTALK